MVFLDAVVVETLFSALSDDHGVYLVEHSLEREFLVAKHQPAGLYAAHIEDIVDYPQQMFCAAADLFKVFARAVVERFILERKAVKSDYRVHRRAYLVAHVRQESGFCSARFLSRHKRVAEHAVALEVAPGFGVDIRKAESYGVHDTVVPVLFAANAGNADHSVKLGFARIDKITV